MTRPACLAPRRPARVPSAVLGLALLTLAIPARAEPAPFRVEGLARGGFLTIREAPEADAAEIDRIPAGQRVQGFGCTSDTPSGNTWCRVKFGRSVGWARRRYLRPE